MEHTVREPLVWSVDDLAAQLGVPKSTIYMWRRKGTGPPAIKVGKYLKFRPHDVADWLETCREPNGGTEAA